MKYILGAVALAFAAPSFAQSSVTLYGVIDLAGQYIKGPAKTVRVTSAGGLAGSRIGFKGTEDIGGGNFVDFVLEGGLNVDTGSSANNGTLFGRQAFGDLRLANVGTFSAGRQYSSLYIQSGEFSAFSNVTGTSASTAVIGGYAGGYEPVQGGPAAASGTTGAASLTAATGASPNQGPARVNNSFRYTTPVFSGFKASVLYGAGEVTGATTKDRLLDGSVRYTNFGLDAYVSIVDDRVANVTDVRTITATASYAIADAHVFAGYLKGDDRRNAAELTSLGRQDGRGIWVGADYRVGASLFKAQWVNNRIDHATTAGDAKTNAYGLGYQYDLSKRTAVYTSLSRFQNVDFGSGNTGRFNGSISGLTSGNDHSLSEFALGVRHSF